MRVQIILSYQNLRYKILSHYRILYNYNKDFEKDYFHEGKITLTIAYDTYKDDFDVKFIIYVSRCIKSKWFNEEP